MIRYILFILLISACTLDQYPPPPVYSNINGLYLITNYEVIELNSSPISYSCNINFEDIYLVVKDNRAYVNNSPIKCSAYNADYEKIGIECSLTTVINKLGWRWDQNLFIIANTKAPFNTIIGIKWITADYFYCNAIAKSTALPLHLEI